MDFYATWCPPCRSAVPVYARMSEAYHSRGVRFYKVDVDKNRDVSGGEGISAMPTFKVYIKGKCVGTQQGWSEAKVKKLIDDVL